LKQIVTRRADSGAATDPIAAPHDTSEVGLVESARAENLNVETVISNPLLPTDRKWAIRFNAGGTVTIVLGMKDDGRGWFSGYFAGLAAARLGVPFRRVRVYYSATPSQRFCRPLFRLPVCSIDAISA
jgi:hypothetical protein